MNKIRRVLRWIGRRRSLLLLVVAAAAWAAYVASAWYLPPLVQRQLDRRFEAATTIEGARLSGVGVEIEGLTMADDESLAQGSPIFFAERLRLAFAPGELLRGRTVVNSAVVQGAVLAAEHDLQRGWNVRRLGLKPGMIDQTARLPQVQFEGAKVQVRRLGQGGIETIMAVGLNGRMTPADEAGMYGFSFQADDRMALSGSQVEGTLRLGLGGRQHRLLLTGQLRMPQTDVLGNAWNVDDVILDCSFGAEAIEVNTLTFRMGRGVGSVTGRAGLSEGRAFEANLDLREFTLSDKAAADALVYGELLEGLPDSGARHFLQRHRPRGLGDVRVQVDGRWDQMAAAKVFGQVVCRDISVQDERFPDRLKQMVGVIDLTGRSLSFDGLACRYGDAEFVISGGIEQFGPESDVWLRVVSGQMCFQEYLYPALGPEGKEIWDSFMPSGTGAIDHHSRWYADGRRTRHLAVELFDVEMTCKYFPYPLDHVTGRVVFEPNRITLTNLVADYPDGPAVRVSGTVSGKDDFSIRVRAERVPVDATLRAALSATHPNFFEQVELDGTVSADVDVFADTSGRGVFDYRAALDIAADRLVHAGFAVPLADTRIAAEARPGQIEIHHLTGRQGRGVVSLSGHITVSGEDPDAAGLCLDIEGEAIDMDERFWQAVEGQFSQMPTAVRLGGPVDISGRLSRNMRGQGCPTTDIAVVCRANPVVLDRHTLGVATGKLHLESESIRLEDFQVDAIELTESLASVLPRRIQDIYRHIEPTGQVEATIAAAELMFNDHRLDRMQAVGQLELKGVNSGSTELFEHVGGVIEGRVGMNPDKHTPLIEADYQVEGFRLRGRDIDRLTGRLVSDPNDGILRSDDLRVVVGNGSATGSASLMVQDEGGTLPYTIDLFFDGIEVDRIVTNQASDLESDDQNQPGQVQGTLTLRGQLGQSDSKRGQLEATVSQMRLGQQTLLGKMLTAIQFREPQEYAFDRLQLQAFVDGDEVFIDRVRILGRPFVFHGDGWMDLQSTEIDMDLVAMGGLAGLEPGFLDSLLRGLGSALWKIEIRGTLSDPDIQTISVPLLRLPLNLLGR